MCSITNNPIFNIGALTVIEAEQSWKAHAPLRAQLAIPFQASKQIY
ncbi:MAG: hypothetical protein JSS30_05450 [Verrucomicrobia bacterium]|nr:hypothetical protein [Verrucomicrobiota bacterium]